MSLFEKWKNAHFGDFIPEHVVRSLSELEDAFNAGFGSRHAVVEAMKKRIEELGETLDAEISLCLRRGERIEELEGEIEGWKDGLYHN